MVGILKGDVQNISLSLCGKNSKPSQKDNVKTLPFCASKGTLR